MTHNAESDAATFAQAFVDLYDAIDGVTLEGWPLYLRAKEYLASVTPPGGGDADAAE